MENTFIPDFLKTQLKSLLDNVSKTDNMQWHENWSSFKTCVPNTFARQYLARHSIYRNERT